MHETFWQSHGDEISAAITIVVAILLALLVDRLILGRGTAVAERMGGGVTREAQTRLRVVRRLLFVLIIVIGIALALSQFASIRRLATGILASTAVLGLVIGFAARQTLANAVAGILLAITQPVRIGDDVTFEDSAGRVQDVTLTYTYIDTRDGRLLVVPNETLITGTVFNHSAGDLTAPITVSAWVPATTDLGAARRALEEVDAESVRVAELAEDSVRIELRAPKDPGRDRGDAEADLRERAQGALRTAGILV